MNNEKLNELVIAYQAQPCEVIFGEIYEAVSPQWKFAKKIAQSIRASEHEVIAMYEDVLLKCLERFDGQSDFLNFFKVCVVRKRADLYAKRKRMAQAEIFEEPTDDGESLVAATIEQIADPTDQAELNTRKADQRQLIGVLLDGADEFTTAIVNAFLNHDNPTARAIAKEIGVHHSKVIRTLNRLAANYDASKYGNYRDYLAS